MKATFSRAVIESMYQALSLQVQALTSKPYGYPKAPIVVNNGSRVSVCVNVTKLWAWARTFDPKIADGFTVEIESDTHLSMSRGDSMIKFEHDALVAGMSMLDVNPIEVNIVDGVAQPVPLPDKKEIKAQRALRAFENKRNALNQNISRLESLIRGATARRAEQAAATEGSRQWLEDHPYLDALANAQLRRDRAREIRRIRAKFEADENVREDLLAVGLLDKPETTTDVDGQEWIDDSSLDLYDKCLADFQEAKQHLDSYAPKKPYSRHARDETRRRQDKCRRAKSYLRTQVQRELYHWEGLLRQTITDYQAHRHQVKKWPRRLREFDAEIAVLTEEVGLLLLQLEQVMLKNNPPVTTQPPTSEVQQSTQEVETVSATAQQVNTEAIKEPSFSLDGDDLTISIPIKQPQRSKIREGKNGEQKGGKMMMIGGTGWERTDVTYRGRRLSAMFSAGFYPADPKRPDKLGDVPTAFTAVAEDGFIRVTLKLGDPEPSSTGKYDLVGGTGGLKPTNIFIAGQRLRISVLTGLKN